MNKLGQMGGARGFALLMVFFVLIIGVFVTIDPFKESLDEVRGNINLNCPGTPNHDVADYNNDTDFEKFVRRPTCFVTGITMIYFIFSFLVAAIVWLGVNWSKTK